MVTVAAPAVGPHILPTPPWWVRLGATITCRLPVGRYRFMNWVARPTAPFLARARANAGGFRFVCDLRDSIAREVCYNGFYEAQETALVQTILKQGMTFVDVGANWGYFSLGAAARVGPTGRVVSIEPDPRLFALFEANIEANDYQNIQAIRAAASDAPGELCLTGFDPDAGNWGLTRIDSGPSGKHSFVARATAIDAELAALGIEHVDLLKMDIEGAEHLALDGMTTGLRAGRYGRLLLELHPEYLNAQGVSPESVIARLTALRYQAWEIRHDRETSRRAAYTRELDGASILVPWENGRTLGTWPHFLFTADGLTP